MRRVHGLLLCALGTLSLARCDCQGDLVADPKPDIEVRDPLSGAVNDDPAIEDDGNAPITIGFGTSEIGTAVQRKVEIKNVGKAPLQVKSLKFAPEAATDPICPHPSGSIRFLSAAEQAAGELTEGSSREVTIQFQASGGSHCRILLIDSDDEDEPQVKVYFTANGEGAQLCAVPVTDRMDFGVTRVGSTKQLTQRLESCGNRAVRISGIAIDQGTGTSFRLDAPTSTPAAEFPPCAADGSNAAACGLDVTVTFAPTARGAVLGWLNVTTGSAAGEVSYPFQLVGQGAECSVSVSPTALNFGSVASGQSVLQTVVVRNSGECNCQVDQITAIDPADKGFTFDQALPAMPLVLSGSQGCDGDPAPTAGASSVTLLVRYTAPNRTNAGTDNASFHVKAAANPTNPDVTVSLEAQGGGTPRCSLEVDPELPATAGGINPFGIAEDQTTYKRFGLVRFGNTTKLNTKKMPISLRNTGNAACEVTALSWDGPATPSHHFGMLDGNGNPITVGMGTPGLSIAPGATLVLNATYTPLDAGEKWNGAKMDATNIVQRYMVCGGSTPFTPNSCDNNGVRIVVPAADNIDTSAIGGGPGVISIGFNAVSVAPAIDVIPQEVDYGMITLGCGSEEREIKIYNTGTGDLVLTATRIDPAATPVEFKITSSPVPPDYTVVPGSSVRVKVRFFPRHGGVHSANLVITSREGTDNYAEFTVPLRGEGTTESHVVDVMQQLTEPKVDVLWVVDDSGSMSDDQEQLANNFPAFFQQTSINNVDFHIAVTTTLYSNDECIPTDPLHPEPCALEPHEKAGYSTACSGNDRIITRTTPNPESQFACDVNVSDTSNVHPDRPTSDSAEAGLFAAKTFLSQPNSTDPAINGGFLRDDAKLYVIMISDEEDQSPGPTDLYVDFFQNLKGFRNRSLVSVSAIAGAVPDGCGEQAEAGTRYKDVVDALGTGLFEDLCQQNWGPTLTDLAFDSFGLKSQFFLTRGADPAAITVCLADTQADAQAGTNCTVVPAAPESSSPTATGYFYEASSNSVVFNAGSIPPRGKWIRVEYDTMCLPVN